MDLSVIIVNYNVHYFLEQALYAVRKAGQGIEMEIWVVDNNSVDDSVNMVRSKFPEVKLITNTHNPGFSTANNQAIRRALGKYILLLNPDTVVEEETFRTCLDFMETHPSAGGLGVRMIDGSGKFLPESKRGFPSPWVAFCRTFGLSRLFPRSPLFNTYHLGHLAEHEIHQVDVLSGAFMFLRRSVLEQIGLLDESFFMYGEDIDLSYRIVQAGYHNYYLPDTTIIHYKGESTKKGSLNYVRTFYQAMIIFARKHFQGQRARLFITFLQAAIYLRAALSLLAGFFRRAYLPLLDGLVIYSGLVFLKGFWARYHFRDSDYYDEAILYFNFPLYTLIWLVSIYLSGGYDPPAASRGLWQAHGAGVRRLVRGLLVGTLVLAAVYGFLETDYRSSRALIVLGAIWALGATVAIRFLLNFRQHGHFRISAQRPDRLVIVGSLTESTRVQGLLQRVGVQKNLIGTVAPHTIPATDHKFLSSLPQLEEVVRIYRINEIIFCSRDVPAERMMYWMTRLGPQIAYKTVPEESLSIIGSQSRHTAGELYTIDIRFEIDTPAGRRNKRLLDISMSLLLVVCSPLLLLFVSGYHRLLLHILRVLSGAASWVGYAQASGAATHLPLLRPGILSPVDGLSVPPLDIATVHRLNYLYAKDYHPVVDLEIILGNWRSLGKKVPQ